MLFLVMVLNFIVAALLYPEIFIRMDYRLVQGHETCGPMQYVFFLIGQFYQGGVQLFDRYDLFNGSYTQLSVGLYTPINFLIAAGYALLSPFVKDPAQFFHHWYLIAYHGLGLMLRTYGVYLLASYMTRSRMTALVSTIWVNCFCAITMIHLGGLCISPVYNYLPLLLFCLVYYWDTRSIKAAVASILVFLLAANNAMYVGFGFFYQTVHLFLFDMLMIWLIFQRRKKPLFAGRFDLKRTLGLVLVIILLFLPVLWWATNIISDFDMAGSGLGGTQGRFNRIYNPHAMMTDPLRYFVSLKDVFHHAYDFTTSGWYLSGAFLGITTMVLALIGLVLGKHSYKVVFITAAVMMGFLNVPSTQGGWMMWAHWVDAITNPFCFLVRSFHYAVLLWYLSIMVPVTLGIQSLWAMACGQKDKIYAGRVPFITGLLASGLIGCFFIQAPVIKAYAIKIIAAFLVFFAVMGLERLSTALRRWLAAAAIAVIVVTEFIVLVSYINTPSVDMNGAYWDGLRVKPRVYSPMHTPPIPMVLDYQNPRTLPVRFFYRTDKQVVFPLLVEFQGMFGQFYQYMPLALRLERPACIYIPRMKIFNNIDQDKQIQEYIARDGRIMYIADAAIAPNQKEYARILDAGLDRRVVQVEAAHEDKVQKLADLALPPAAAELFKNNEYVFPSIKASVLEKKDTIQYQWRLPADFPRYLSTGVFTADAQLWRLLVGNDPLTIAQGALVYPGTFDVNNVRDGYLTVLMSKSRPVGRGNVMLTVATPAALMDVWRNTQDQFGFTYNNPRSGWWVMHMPYDPKWQLFIDGKKTPIARVNRYFIGAPLSAGEHQILLTYWPDSPLRPLIIVSLITALLIMIWVFRTTYRWSKT